MVSLELRAGNMNLTFSAVKKRLSELQNGTEVDAVSRTVVGMSVDGLHVDVHVVTFVVKQPVAGANSHVVTTRCFSAASQLALRVAIDRVIELGL